jgi:prophage regulatory protein
MKILRIPSVVEKIGLSKRAIYDRMDKTSPRYDETFPRPIPLGDSRNSPVGFIESEIEGWLSKRVEKRISA